MRVRIPFSAHADFGRHPLDIYLMETCKCGKEFSNIRSLRTHARFCSVYEKKEKKKSIYLVDGKYVCECKREFSSSQSLNGHFSCCLVHRNGVPHTKDLSNCGWSKGLSKESHPSLQKMADSLTGRIGHKHTDETKDLISRKTKGKNGGYRENSNRAIGSYYNGIWMDSSYEVRFATCLDKLNISWKKNHAKFDYEFHDSIKKYIPDFFLEEYDTYVEVKGVIREADQYKWKAFPKQLKIVMLPEIIQLERGEFLEWMIQH